MCGCMFVPVRKNSRTCQLDSCRSEWRRVQKRTYVKDSIAGVLKEQQQYRTGRERKPDTIIAIGYADRQKARTLEMAGKIKVTL